MAMEKDVVIESAAQANLRRLQVLIAAGALAAYAVEAVGVTRRLDRSVSESKRDIVRQLGFAYKGNLAVIDALNDIRLPEQPLTPVEPEVLLDEFEEWITDDKVKYVYVAQEADRNTHFTLVARPAVLTTPQEVDELALEFGMDQPVDTSVQPLCYEYTAEELSGAQSGNGNVIFCLMPDVYTPGMDGTVTQQRTKLAELQIDTPDLRVPSVLDAITYWHTLRGKGDLRTENARFETGSTLTQTFIRHFDLPDKNIDEGRVVLNSYLSDSGGAGLGVSNARNEFYARLALG